MRRSLHPSFGQASGVRSALHPSGVLAVSGEPPEPPVWTVDPTALGGPWPGGLVVGTAGTVSPGTPTYEWEIDAVGTGDTSFATFAPSAAQYDGDLTLVGDASGVTATSSPALALQRLRGVTRPAEDADYLTTGSFALPADGCSLLVEAVGYSTVGNVSIALALATSPVRYVSLQTSADGESLIGEVATASGTASATLAIGPELVDGATRWFALVTYDSAEGVRIRYAVAGDVASQTDVSALSGSLAGTATLASGIATGFSGSTEAKVFDRALNDAAFLAVVASPIGIAGLDADPDILGEYLPAPGSRVQEDTITLGSQIDPAATLTTGSARQIAGRLNAGDALGAPVWLVGPVASDENWPGGTMAGRGVVTPGALSSAAYEWKVDGTGTGELSPLYLVDLADLGLDVVYAGAATNAIGTTPADSAAVTVVQVEGLIRATTSSVYLTRAISAIGSAGALVMHVALSAVDSGTSLGAIFGVGRYASTPNRFGVHPYVDATGSPSLVVAVLYGPSTGDAEATGLAVPAIDGVSDYYVIVEWTGGTSFTAYVGTPGGSWSTHSWTAAGSPAHGTSVQAVTWNSPVIAGVRPAAGTLEAVALDRVTTSDERAAILAAGDLAESGIFAATGRLATLRPVAASAVDGATAAAAEVEGTWTLAGSGTGVVFGGFNVPV